MSHTVSFRSAAERQFSRLPKSGRADLLPAIAALSDEPRPHGCKKLEGSHSTYRVRVGRYRIVYDVDDKVKTVRVMGVVDRKDAYN